MSRMYDSAQCHPDLPRLIDRARVIARNQAINRGASFVIIGIVQDWDIWAGVPGISASFAD